MERLSERKIVLVVRETRLDNLKARFNTSMQARFYVESLGGDFEDYVREDAVYRSAVATVSETLGTCGRLQIVQRAFLPNFIFGSDDLVVALGQDGLVANTVKYLNGQPLIGVNPDPGRYDGVILPFLVSDVRHVVSDALKGKMRFNEVTMAKAALNNGQTLYAVNDLFVGPASHGSARYRLSYAQSEEFQSSSGIIISTGLGSTGWFRSVVAGASGIFGSFSQQELPARGNSNFDRNSEYLMFAVREPFPSKTTQTNLVFGQVTGAMPLGIASLMPERGIIFSDGIESDFLEFNSGAAVTITPAERKGLLVI
ncbi:sugar kinase [Nibricoccus sp. IMCC34717]|uniref:sugar kinase n=1 Tax=Nibricoccus sp. IMCC34717 TaxID=3034021 RepID=UPI00384BB4D5